MGQNKEFENKKGLIDEFSKLLDIHTSIDVAKKESDRLIERHNEFISNFFPKIKPEGQLNYNLNYYYKKYETKRKEFIKCQNDKLQQQIEIIYNLNSNNGFVLNEFTNNKDLKECLLSKIESNLLVRKIQQKFQIKYSSNNIGIFTLEAYKDIFFERGVFDETPFKQIEKELNKRKCLLNNLHAVYVICRFWYSDDLIKHGLEIDTGEVEHVYARGFSEKWKKNIEKKLNNEKPLSATTENRLFLNEQQEKDLKKFPQKKEIYSKFSQNIIIEVEIPKLIRAVFSDIISNLKKILTSDELNTILDFFNIDWIKNESISINDFTVIDLKTHLLFNLGNDFDFLSNKNNSYPFHYFPNQSVYEPVCLTLLEEVGIKFLDSFSSNEEFNKSYKILHQKQVDKIDEIIQSWELYKSSQWYYSYDEYHFKNK